MLTTLFVLSPLLASHGMNIVECVIYTFLILVLVALVVLIIPIITAIVGVIKNKQNLKVFSKIYAMVLLAISSLSFLYNKFELWEFHLVFIFMAVVPLVILEAFKKRK